MIESSGKGSLSQKSVSERPADLPEFDNPPVSEVVLSVQFSELQKYRLIHVGLLWDRFRRSGFNDFSEHLPLEQRYETFGPQETPQPKLKIITSKEMPMPRFWFIKEGGNELVQVQADRFVRNWRKIGPEEVYPRYEKIRDSFFDELSDLQAFFDEQDVGKIQPNQCEVTYVNLISFDGDTWENPHVALKVFSKSTLDSDDGSARLPKFENANYSARFILSNEQGEAIGRLIVSLRPAISPDELRVLRLEITARGAPITPDLEGVGRFFDFGRDAIVRGFTAITTNEMHELWERHR